MIDTRVEVRIYNKIFYDLIFQEFKSIAQFSKASKIHQSTIGDFLNVRRKSPFLHNGEYCKIAKRIATFFNIEPDLLFPSTLYKVQGKGIAVLEFDSQVIACTDRSSFRRYLPETELMDESVRQGVNEALDTLNPAERKVITMRVVEGKTLADCGKELHLTRERARQIEDKALLKLRQPGVIKKLEEIR